MKPPHHLQASDARLRRLIVMLSSPNANEVFATTKAIGKHLEKNGMDWYSLADRLANQTSIPLPPWQPPHDTNGMSDADRARWCLDHGTGRLSFKEREFLFNLSRRRSPPTPKQRDWLADLHERLSQRT